MICPATAQARTKGQWRSRNSKINLQVSMRIIVAINEKIYLLLKNEPTDIKIGTA
jgi:hypothetical protein